MKQGQMFYTLDSSVKVIQVISSLRRIFLNDGEFHHHQPLEM